MAESVGAAGRSWASRHHCLLGVWAFVLVFSICMLGPGASVASAALPQYDCQTDGHGKLDHCYSIGAKQIDTAGLAGGWNDVALTIPDSYVQYAGFISNEIWLIDSTHCAKQCQWVEMGLQRACSKFVFSGTCLSSNGVPRYQTFYAEGGENGYFGYHAIGAASVDGVEHWYDMIDNSNGANDTYDYYLDGLDLHSSVVQLESSMDRWNVGIEAYPGDLNVDDANIAADNLDNSLLVYRNSVGSWQTPIMDVGNSYDVDSSEFGTTKNGIMNPCAYFPDTICLHGSRTTDYEWSDSKPG